MPHETPLIATISIGIALAFVLGLLAQKLKLPPIAGYVTAGIVVGPFTPGYVADQQLAAELAEIGVILLMFGVGLHFSFKDLMAVRRIAIPGALAQITVATVLGMALGWLLGWTPGAGFVFGLALSVASTVVLLRALEERRMVETERGRIAVGWLVVEDLVMVLTLVLIPPIAGLLGGEKPATTEGAEAVVSTIGFNEVSATILLTVVKVTLFMAIMIVIGRRLIPLVLHFVAHTGSRELFRLAVLAIALGFAFTSAQLFGVSFALGAFFAGMVLSESPLSTQAARETLPLRDAFAVLFFVSVGMLFDPAVLFTQPLAILATALIVIVGKAAAAYAIVRAFGHDRPVALTIAVSLAQIGEFSFILVVMGVTLEVMPTLARDLVVAGAILSILANPLVFKILDRYMGRLDAQQRNEAADERQEAAQAEKAERSETPTSLVDHVVIIGHGRVGGRIAAELVPVGIPFLVVEEDAGIVADLKGRGWDAYRGSSGDAHLLPLINLDAARVLVAAIPDAFEAGHIVEHARERNPAIHIIARAQSEEAAEYLRERGANSVLLGEEEVARGLARDIRAEFARPKEG